MSKTKEQLLEEQLNAEPALPTTDERTELKNRADELGLKYAANISTPKLRMLVAAKLNGEELPEDTGSDETVTDEPAKPKAKTRGQLRAEALKLVRFKLVCQNPDRQQQPSITVTCVNNVVGQVTRVLPLNPDHYNDGWHAEQCIVDQLRQKKFSQHRKEQSQDKRTQIIKLVATPEFIITELPPLTKEELAALAKRQANSGSLSNN